MPCSKVRKAPCEVDKDCIWIKRKGCRLSPDFIRPVKKTDDVHDSPKPKVLKANEKIAQKKKGDAVPKKKSSKAKGYESDSSNKQKKPRISVSKPVEGIKHKKYIVEKVHIEKKGLSSRERDRIWKKALNSFRSHLYREYKVSEIPYKHYVKVAVLLNNYINKGELKQKVKKAREIKETKPPKQQQEVVASPIPEQLVSASPKLNDILTPPDSFNVQKQDTLNKIINSSVSNTLGNTTTNTKVKGEGEVPVVNVKSNSNTKPNTSPALTTI